MLLPQFYIDDIIKKALEEDINYLDTATAYVIPETTITTAKFVSKAQGVLCGIDVAMRVFRLLDPDCHYTVYKKDGDKINKGDVIATMDGRASMLLQGERTALNLLQHMSGIATATNECVSLVEGTNVSIADTRKTIPGLRALQKYAVTCGGGKNHRYNLSDCAMLKDNHIDAGGGITATVQKLREKIGHTVKIEVETRNMAEVKEAVEAGADIIMLDNMSAAEMKEAVAYIDGRALTEASGNITAENIKEKALSGVDIISMGALTHSVKAFDISMRID
ncbi:MAG: carboxylating nicotinate-nucleotide diphosphorylase [Ruminococcaceae bacterium]|nr:carboxylating nicotinate-nucleotide diphosphorylase [Oscillospiraceae bacterium]MBR3596452.1 carboxylating nicotinate-nucleotide diphosphorylase [Clostridia bacterium]